MAIQAGAAQLEKLKGGMGVLLGGVAGVEAGHVVKGWKVALAESAHLRNGLNIALGKVTYEAVARDLGYAYVKAENVIAQRG
jgi:alanine dehydrogenase